MYEVTGSQCDDLTKFDLMKFGKIIVNSLAIIELFENCRHFL